MRIGGLLAAMACLMVLSGWMAKAQEAGKATATANGAAGGMMILEAGKTFWRYYEVWRNDAVKQESGEIVTVDLVAPVQGKDARGNPMPDSLAWRDYWEPRKGQAGIRAAKSVVGAPLPPDGWEQTGFDDQSWSRDLAIQRQAYRAIHSMYLRGKFEVTDPSRVSDLDLSIGFRGGIVVYLNGKEIKRTFLPEGIIGPDTLATEYPRQAYIQANGSLIDQTAGGTAQTFIPAADLVLSTNLAGQNLTFTNAENVANYKLRYRHCEAQIPAKSLRKGVNVLAVLIRRAPANEAMYTSAWPKPKYFDQSQWYYSLAWNRCDLEDLKLTAAHDASGIVPNIAPPKGARVWVHRPIHQPLVGPWFAEPNEPVGSIALRGVRNGVYSGEIVVSSTDPIRDLKVEASELKGPAGKTIATSELAVGFAQATDHVYFGQFDALASTITNEIKSTFWRWSYGWRPDASTNCLPIQPIWVTVKVPKTAVAGEYVGRIAITMADQKPVDVPVSMQVLGDWAMPDSQDFSTYVGFVESADAPANRFKVPLWSEAHWKLLDEVFEKYGDLGVKEIYVPITGKTHVDNEQSMVRWIKQDDGTYKHDYRIAEKYVDTALKHLRNIKMVCVVVYSSSWTLKRATRFYTEFDPKTGQVKEMEAPEWGTPEARAFWKPVIEGMRQMLGKKGLDKVMMIGLTSDGCDKGCWEDLNALFPDVKWVVRSHQHPKVWWGGKRDAMIGQESCMFGTTLGVSWDPEVGGPQNFGWKVSPFPGIIYPAFARVKDNREFNHGSTVAKYRSSAEGAILTPCGNSTYQGLGSYGGDFWGGWRYTDYGSTTCGIIRWIIGADQDGPVHTVRSRMMQESLQDAEVRIILENILMDATRKAKLGVDLVQRARTALNDRTRMISYLSLYYDLPMNTFDPNGTHWGKGLPVGWDDQTVKLYQVMDEVAKALER